MRCDVAALPFQANANYGTWLIYFEFIKDVRNKESENDTVDL